MKFSFCAMGLAALLIPTVGSAQFVGPSEIYEMTAAQARLTRDDVWITLEGVLGEKVGDKTYEFRDDSGSVALKFDYGLEPGQPGSRIKVRGTVDCRVGDVYPVYVEVDHILEYEEP